MWILKGFSYATLVYIFFTVAVIVYVMYSSSAQATGIPVLTDHTIRQPFYWLAYLLLVVVFCMLTRSAAVKH
jgi:hypothetical protein